jgi:predicted AAA+ superfamily ATPase
MSLWESGESTGEVSLANLFSNPQSISGVNNYKLGDIAFLICRGGFPNSVLEQNKQLALVDAKEYINTLLKTDITNVDEIKRNPQRARFILRSYARHISTSAAMQTILRDIEVQYMAEDIKTIYSYINAFEMLFVIEETESWSPRLRSKAVIRTTNTRHFSDPSFATVVLGASPNDLLNDLQTFGLVFENLVIRDLKIYTDMLGGSVYNYRDNSGLEADAIIHLNNGKWGLVEIKLGGESLINEGAANLIKLRDKIDYEVMKKPSFLAVITAVDQFAYRREDGVFVIPIGCLKP